MSTYERIAGLELRIEGYDLLPLAKEVASGFARRTTVVRLSGGGAAGLGEDVAYHGEDQERFQAAGPVLPLAGRWTLESFSARLSELELWSAPPALEQYREYRRWAFESAALGLALAQAGRTLPEVLGLAPRPLTFVVSTGLGSPPTTARLEAVLARRPEARFKLDATPAWTDELVRELASLGRVDVVDFKGAYHGTTVDQPADPALYERVLAGLPEAVIEDPHRVPEVERLLEGCWNRVAWDAPLHSVADLRALEGRFGSVNVKPSRLGTWRELLGVVDLCRERRWPMYAGGQFELGVGRSQTQLLAALFHPDAANDIAPLEYHAADPGPEATASPMQVDARWC